MASISAKIIPPPAPPEPRVKLELDLSVDEAFWLKELSGSVCGCRTPARVFTSELFCALLTQLEDLPDYADRIANKVFGGQLHTR